MITIKPHHFIDIIKLYGAGIEKFVPDEKMNHDFYKIANEIMDNHDVELTLTIDDDDICQPCVQCINDICDDGLPSALGLPKKDEYNKMLDRRIINLYSLLSQYSAMELCQILYAHKEFIFDVWKEEADYLTQKRYELFCKGAIQYFNK